MVLSPLLATIPYKTFPVIELGPLTLRTFGLAIAAGVVLGIWFGAAHGERYGVTRDEAYRLGTRMVIAGVVGARLTWVATHLDQIDNPIDVIAVWEGGLQFSGGFILAIAVGLPTFLRWNRLQRWQLLDGYAVAVTIGAGFGRLGCLAVGEHFGRESSFFLATRFEGAFGSVGPSEWVREPTLGLDPGSTPVVPGVSFLNPALYECVTMFVLFGALYWMLRKGFTPGTVGGTFLIAYSVQRFAYDSMRVNDERVLGMTGAQWMCLAMIPIGIYVLVWVRRANARAIAAGEIGGTPVWETTTTTAADGREVATRKRRPSAARPAHATARATSAGAADDADDTDDAEDAPAGESDDVDRLDREGTPEGAADAVGRDDGEAAATGEPAAVAAREVIDLTDEPSEPPTRPDD